jgi:FkbM family methyltransferase
VIRSLFDKYFDRTVVRGEPESTPNSNGGILNESNALLEADYVSKLDRRIVVVDVGCRWGFAERYLSQINSFQVYGFDPDAEECTSLNERYSSKFVKAVPLGLSGESGKRILYLTREPACSSLIKPDEYLTKNYPALGCALEVGCTTVETITLNEWARSEGVLQIDHLKIDTQGSELEILYGGSELLKTIRSIEVEVEFNPIYEGQPVFSDIDQYLRAEGFVLWKFSNLVHYSRRTSPGAPIGKDIICFDDFHSIDTTVYAGQIYWANAHYVNKEIVQAFGSLDPNQKARDMVLFNVLGMPDVIGVA